MHINSYINVTKILNRLHMVTIFPRKASCDTFCHIHLIIDSYDGYFFKILSKKLIECEEKRHFLSKQK